MTSSKSFNYESVKAWLSKPENKRYTENLELVINLDSVSTQNQFFLQIFNNEEGNLKNNALDTLLKVKNNIHSFLL